MSILRKTPLTHLLLAALFGAYVALLSAPPEQRARIITDYAAGNALDYRLLVALFLHLGPAHLLFNLGGIWACGVWVEYRLPLKWYAPVVLWSGVASWLVFVLRQPTERAVGASGIFAGLAGTALAMGDVALRWAGWVTGLLWLVYALSQPVPGSNDVHAAGLLAGCLAGWLLRGRVTRPAPAADQPR